MTELSDSLHMLLAPATARPSLTSRPALVKAAQAPDGADGIVTFGQLDDLAGRAQAALTACCVKSGEIVMLCAPNSPELVASILACWRLGAVAVPVDARLTRGEVENIAVKIQARVIASRERLTDKIKTVVLSDLPVEAAAYDVKAAAHEALAPALVILTSGTTGIPKGAVHDLESLVSNVNEMAGTFGLTESDSAILPLPVSHIFGLAVTLANLLFGGCTVFYDFNPQDFWGCVARLEPTMLIGVPTMYGALLNLPSPPPEAISIKFYLSGGAPLPVSLAEEFERRFGRRIIQGYGATETKILSFNADGPAGSVGRPLPSVKIEIADDADRPLPPGELGEIRIAGPTLMQGYLGQPEATAPVLHDGHYHTGDIGYIDNGYVFISGRSKEMIIVAGNKVFPAEVESVLRQHPLVNEVAVIGVPHSRLGQLVKAVIVVNAGSQCDLLCGSDEERKLASMQLTATFREFCKANLKRELRPMDWEFRPVSCPLPKTTTGKVDKKQLEPVSA